VSGLPSHGRVPMLTSAGRGVGRSHARELASRGAKVVVVDPGVALDGSGFDKGPADDTVDTIRGYYGHVGC
jgi:NAD(P)-dependent dehydrogenase (short-subunit alcohol dehydrogenase family)